MQPKLPEAIWEGFEEEVTFKLLMGWSGREARGRNPRVGAHPGCHPLTTVPKADSVSLPEATEKVPLCLVWQNSISLPLRAAF